MSQINGEGRMDSMVGLIYIGIKLKKENYIIGTVQGTHVKDV